MQSEPDIWIIDNMRKIRYHHGGDKGIPSRIHEPSNTRRHETIFFPHVKSERTALR